MISPHLLPFWHCCYRINVRSSPLVDIRRDTTRRHSRVMHQLLTLEDISRLSSFLRKYLSEFQRRNKRRVNHSTLRAFCPWDNMPEETRFVHSFDFSNRGGEHWVTATIAYWHVPSPRLKLLQILLLAWWRVFEWKHVLHISKRAFTLRYWTPTLAEYAVLHQSFLSYGLRLFSADTSSKTVRVVRVNSRRRFTPPCGYILLLRYPQPNKKGE